MSKEEIRHFKTLLRQGSLRHMNILLDDKFQSELLNIIKDYELLEKENKQLKEDTKLILDYSFGEDASSRDKIYGEHAKATLKFMK